MDPDPQGYSNLVPLNSRRVVVRFDYIKIFSLNTLEYTVTGSYAMMAVNSRTSHVHFAVTMLARVKIDVVVLPAKLPPVKISKAITKLCSFVDWRLLGCNQPVKLTSSRYCPPVCSEMCLHKGHYNCI
ncbi:hypothetical protein GUJ93_ZPchr0002g23638 [Zizania palustris]|uniref:Uncharacterized protein n=1 Tax=Zizania palustris TaxID=103762 RepID=A0A8J5VBF6_ZIZPA|nr:hypothetical protein GUJ93_ZPchr0002g23638 [Zizania palustris]